MNGFLIRCGVTGLAVLLASQIIPGIEIHGFAAGLVAVIVLSFLNAMVRPLLYLLSAPFIVLTLGLFMVVINAFLLNLVAMLVKGFVVEGFWPAVGGAIFISLVSGILNLWISEKGRVDVVMTHRPRNIRHIN
ncbi:MAG: phage holin family protein [Nitrospirota bacterium]|nr:MAG: phage holin family protein [Nitrospirota bacterium]